MLSTHGSGRFSHKFNTTLYEITAWLWHGKCGRTTTTFSHVVHNCTNLLVREIIITGGAYLSSSAWRLTVGRLYAKLSDSCRLRMFAPCCSIILRWASSRICCQSFIHSFIHSFILNIYIAPLQENYSEAQSSRHRLQNVLRMTKVAYPFFWITGFTSSLWPTPGGRPGPLKLTT